MWTNEALPIAKIGIGNGILHIRGDHEVTQMTVSIGGFVDIYDMRLPPARSLILRAAVPLDEARYRWSDASGN